MPRKAKEKKELNEIKENTTTKSKKAKTVSSSSSKKSTSTKTTSTTTKKANQKKPTTKKTNSTTKKKSSTKKSQVQIIPTEYYDLPQKYNETVVKILAQTPKTLFIYWEISDEDIEKYKTQYGKNFFEITKPILIIHNTTLNYNFEVEINDFANSWYLHINDSKSNYMVELGRRPIKNYENTKKDYIYITSSNKIESPNDHILFNTSQKMVYFRNLKTGQITEKSTNLYFIRNMGKIYNIYDSYKNEDNLDVFSNPSS